MSSEGIHPKQEDVTRKPKVTVATVLPNAHRKKADKKEADREKTDETNKSKVTVATVLPNAHRKKADQEAADRDKTDDAVPKKPKPSPAMLRRTLTKVKEVNSDDEHHLTPDDHEEDQDRMTVDKEKTKDAHREDRETVTEDEGKTKDADQEESLEKNAKSNQTEDEPGTIVPYEANGQLVDRGKKKKKQLPIALSAQESADHHDYRAHRAGWVIRKDDEFFHFIIMCFAFGAVLVCYHNYADWTISAGIGLLTFASLEIIGIYFGFVTRIRAVIEGFLPLFQRSALAGLSKEK